MSAYSEKPSRFPWPVIIFASATCLALIANEFFSGYWLIGPIAEFLFALGWLVLLAALLLISMAIQHLWRENTTVSPMKGSTHLVTKGVFAISRNPIYLGFATAMVGLSLIIGSIWFIIFMFPAAFAVQKFAIEPEEQHLQQRFGRKWRDYSRKIRRWI